MRIEQESNFASLFDKDTTKAEFQSQFSSYDFTDGFNFAEHLLSFEQLKETVSAPFDKAELLQVLANPQQVGGYITVETITQNVFPAGSPLFRPEVKLKNLDRCKCGQKMEKFKKYGCICSICRNKRSKFHRHLCDDDYYKYKCDQCYAREFLEEMVRQKTILHQTYLDQTVSINSDVQITEPTPPNLQELPSSQIYTSVRFWNDQNECVGHLYLEDELILFKNKFILVGESQELFYFQKSKEIEDYTFSEIDFRKILQDTQEAKLRPLKSVSVHIQQVPNLRNRRITWQSTDTEQNWPRLFNKKLVWTSVFQQDVEQKEDLPSLLQGVHTVVHDLTSAQQFHHPRCLIFFGRDNQGSTLIGKEYWETEIIDNDLQDINDLKSKFRQINSEELTSEKFRNKVTPPTFQSQVDALGDILQLDYKQFGKDLYYGTKSMITNGAETTDTQLRKEIVAVGANLFFVGSSIIKLSCAPVRKSTSVVSLEKLEIGKDRQAQQFDFEFDLTGIGEVFEVEDVILFEDKEKRLKLLISWQNAQQRYLALVESSQNIENQLPLMLNFGAKQNFICCYPLLISQSLRSHNQVMIANLQLNSPQICLNFGNQTVIGFAADTQYFEDFGLVDTESEISVQYVWLYVLLKKGSDSAEVVVLQIDCFNLDQATAKINWDQNRKPEFWTETFKSELRNQSHLYSPRVIKAKKLKAVAVPLRAQKDGSKEFYGDLASFKFWEVFYSTSNQPHCLQTAEKICHQPDPAIKMTALTSDGIFYVEPSVDGDVLFFVNSQTKESKNICTFAGLAVIAMRVIDFDRGQLQLLTDNFELHESGIYPQQMGASEKLQRRKGQNAAQDFSFEILVMRRGYGRVIAFDDQMCILKLKDEYQRDNQYVQYSFRTQYIQLAFMNNLFVGQDSEINHCNVDLVPDVEPIRGTDLLLITKKDNQGQKFAHVVPMPSSRQIPGFPTKLTYGSKRTRLKLDFLPNGLACFHKTDLLFVYCPATSMMVYADKVGFKLSEQNQVLEVGKNTFYKKDGLWVFGEGMQLLESKIASELSLPSDKNAKQFSVLKYLSGVFYLLRFQISNSLPKTSESSKVANLKKRIQVLGQEISVECLDIELQDENPKFGDSIQKIRVWTTQNFLVFQYEYELKAIRISTRNKSANKESEIHRVFSFHHELYSDEEIYQVSVEDALLMDPKQRDNVIAIGSQILWDLDQNELLKSRSSFSNASTRTRSGMNSGFAQNESRTLIQHLKSPQILNYFSRYDLERMVLFFDYLAMNEERELEYQFDLEFLFANFRNRTLLSVLVKLVDPKYIRIISDEVVRVLADKDTSVEILQDLHNTLRLPCFIDTEVPCNELAEYLGISPRSQNDCKDIKQSVLHQALGSNDLTSFRLLLRLLIKCDKSDISLYDIVQDCKQFGQLIGVNCPEVKELLNLCSQNNYSGDQINELNFQDSIDRISFTSNTSALKESEIKESFFAQVQRPVGFGGFLSEIITTFVTNRLVRKNQDNLTKIVSLAPNYTTVKCNIHVLEIEWLERQIAVFLSVVIKDDSNFDNELVKNLLGELDFWYPLFVFMFLPFMAYFGLVTYYLCFVVSDAFEPRTGFTQGSDFAVALRFLILIFTAYQFFIEYLQLKEQGIREYFKVQNIRCHLQNFMRLLNIWIITEHSTNFTSVGSTRLAQVASLEQFQLWYNVLEWMRIFDGTAVYVRLVYDTVWNTRYFMIMLLIIICTFGSSFLILDRQAKILKQFDDASENYIQVQTATMGYDVTDSFIYQYLVMYGAASQEGFESNPSRVLLWLYYIVAIFLTNVTFLNLLIAVMSTTYETVMETKERGMLIERTRIYQQYIGALNAVYPTIQNKFNRRYMYIATKHKGEDQDRIGTVESSIASFKKDMRREIGDLKMETHSIKETVELLLAKISADGKK